MSELIKSALGADWYERLKEEFSKGYMIDLSRFLQQEREEFVVYPCDTHQTFAVFRNTPFNRVRVVILGQDPYHDGSYDGMAFSNTKSDSISPSLRNILKEVKNDIYDGLDINQDQSPSLKRWQDEGVLLLNRVLTVRQNKPDSHGGLGWEIFIDEVINILSTEKQNLVFMLWGKKAQTIIPVIENKENHLILTCDHPSPLSANRPGATWFGCKHFSQANDYLIKHKLDYIQW